MTDDVFNVIAPALAAAGYSVTRTGDTLMVDKDGQMLDLVAFEEEEEDDAPSRGSILGLPIEEIDAEADEDGEE